MEERKARLIWYLDRNPYITSTYYRALNHCSKYSAQQDLSHFVDSGLLIRQGYRSSTTYHKNEALPLIAERLIPEK